MAECRNTSCRLREKGEIPYDCRCAEGCDRRVLRGTPQWRKQDGRRHANCLKNGCMYVDPAGEACEGCGFDRTEYQRRKKLPLEQLQNGLRGKVMKKTCADCRATEEKG